MKPIMPIPKKANGFSIDSLMRKDSDPRQERPTTSSVSSGEDSDHGEDALGQVPTVDERLRISPSSRLPPLHPSLPEHVKQLLLNGANGATAADVLALRSQAWAFSNGQAGIFPQLTNGVHSYHSQLTHGIGAPGVGVPGVGLHPTVFSPNRDPTSMYSWLMSRQSAGFYGMPFPGPPETGFLFHPYRKPKRIRTAFSPAQLLKLEHAFEKNHYVVGQERKELASKLNLTETQVKVWFQNRRTKHKRVQSEEDPEMEDISVDDEEAPRSSNHYEEHFQRD